MSETMVERVGKAIDAVQIWSRFNDWTSDRVEGMPVEICRYGKEGEAEIVVLRRISTVKDVGDALREVVSDMRARAAIEAMRFPVGASSVPGGLAIEESMFGSEDTVFHGAAKSFNAILDAALTTPGE